MDRALGSKGLRRFNTLFWNLLAALAGAMFLSGLLGFAIAFGLRYPGLSGPILQGPFGDDRAAYAADIARIGGLEGLTLWLSEKSLSGHGFRTYAVDDEGRSVTGPRPPAEALAAARSEIAKNPAASGIRRVSAGGKELLIFTAKPPSSFLAESSRYLFGPHPGRFWINCLISLGVAALVAFLLAWWISRPVRRLEQAMDRAASGDFSVRISDEFSHSSHEFQQLSTRFDRMAATIGQLLSRQQTLFHSVSHELRSPLARMNCAVELARRAPEQTDRMLSRIEGDVQKLDGLVGALLTYTRLDADVPAKEDAVEFELCDLLCEIAENARLEASARHVEVDCDLPDKEIPMRGSPQVLAHAVENVVRNALRFSPEGGAVRLKAQASGDGSVRIDVEDEGPGMDPAEMSKLFEPFVRGANQATGSGFGLGLAIARQAAHRMRGEISAENRKPHGLRMTFEFPAAGASDGGRA